MGILVNVSMFVNYEKKFKETNDNKVETIHPNNRFEGFQIKK
jgi:hypothetical protein